MKIKTFFKLLREEFRMEDSGGFPHSNSRFPFHVGKTTQSFSQSGGG
jgi:hypothetical protein